MSLTNKLQSIVRWRSCLLFFLLQMGSYYEGYPISAVICMIAALIMTVDQETIMQRFKCSYWLFYGLTISIALMLLMVEFDFTSWK